MKEKNEPNALDRTFDYLSAIPWLKNLMKNLWIFSTVAFGIIIILESSAVLMKKIHFRSELIKNIILYITINSFFARVFYLWNKRNRTSKMKNTRY